jgi:hypothetical protein
MPNILFISGKNFLNSAKGAEIRILELVKGLGRENRVIAVNFDDGKRTGNPAEQLNELGVTLFNIRIRHPAQKLFWPGVYLDCCRVLREQNLDAIICSHVWSVPCALGLARMSGLPLFFDDHNVEHDLLRQQGRRVASALVKWLESSVLRRATLTFAVSEADMLLLAPWARAIEVLPNGTSLHPPDVEVRPKRPVVLFFGSLGYEPNREAVRIIAERIAPSVTRRIPEVEFRIVGRPAPNIRVPNVTVVGFVERIEDELDRAVLTIVPLLHGSGTRIKIMDSLARHRPVVSTPKGAEGTPNFESLKIVPLDRFPDTIVETLRRWKDGEPLFSDRDRQAILRHSWADIADRLASAVSREIALKQDRVDVLKVPKIA